MMMMIHGLTKMMTMEYIMNANSKHKYMEEDLFEFRPIPGYEGLYSVNQSNQVKSHERKVAFKDGYKTVKEKILKGGKQTGGYLVVNLCKPDTKIWYAGVHILVAMAWGLPKEPYHNVVKHLDNNVINNVPGNLQWDTNSQNVIDANHEGLGQRGANHHNVKLTKENVLHIRNSELKNAELSRLYNVSNTAISLIRSNKSWKHI